MSVATELPDLIESAIATAQNEFNNSKDMESQLHTVQDNWANANVLEVVPLTDYQAKPASSASSEDMLKRIQDLQAKEAAIQAKEEMLKAKEIAMMKAKKADKQEEEESDSDLGLMLDSDSDQEEPKKKKGKMAVSPRPKGKSNPSSSKKKPAKSDSDSDDSDSDESEEEDAKPSPKKKNKRSVSPKKSRKSEDEAMDDDDDDDEPVSPAPSNKSTLVAKVIVPKKTKIIDLSEDDDEIEEDAKRGKKRSRDSDEEQSEKSSSSSKKKKVYNDDLWSYYYIDRSELDFLLEHPNYLIKRDRKFVSKGMGKTDYKFVCSQYSDKLNSTLRKFMQCGNCRNCARSQRFCTNNSNSKKFHETNRIFYAIDKGSDKIQIVCTHCYNNGIPCMVEKGFRKSAFTNKVIKAIQESHEKYVEDKKFSIAPAKAKTETKHITLTESHESLVKKAIQPLKFWSKAVYELEDPSWGLTNYVTYEEKGTEVSHTVLDVLAEVLVLLKKAYPKQEEHFKLFKLKVANKVDVAYNLQHYRHEWANNPTEAEKQVEAWADPSNGLHEVGAASMRSVHTASNKEPSDNFFVCKGDHLLALKKKLDAALTATDYESKEPKSLLNIFNLVLNLLSWIGRIVIHGHITNDDMDSINMPNLVAFKNTLLCLL